MHIVVSRPYDDKTIVDTYLVEHTTKTKEDFESDWDTILSGVKEKEPETWNVSQVLVGMKRRGWQILYTEHIKVTY
jgi:hypothetical protein